MQGSMCNSGRYLDEGKQESKTNDGCFLWHRQPDSLTAARERGARCVKEELRIGERSPRSTQRFILSGRGVSKSNQPRD